MVAKAAYLFRNPYISSNMTITRLTVCLATFLWGLVVAFIPETLTYYPSGRIFHFNHHVNEIWYVAGAFGAMAVSLYQCACTLRWCPQTLVGDLAGSSMVLLWTLVCLSIWAYARPLPAPNVACTTAVMFLSWWNLLAPARRF